MNLQRLLDCPFIVRFLLCVFYKITHKPKIEDRCLCAILQFTADKFHGHGMTGKLSYGHMVIGIVSCGYSITKSLYHVQRYNAINVKHFVMSGL